MKYGIRRERTQLVLIEDFVRVITNNNQDKKSSSKHENFKSMKIISNSTAKREKFVFSFKNLCIKGYRILRRQYRQIVCLFKLMMNCDLTELNSEADMAYLRQTFAIDIGANEQEACSRFEQVLIDSYKSSAKNTCGLDFPMHLIILSLKTVRVRQSVFFSSSSFSLVKTQFKIFSSFDIFFFLFKSFIFCINSSQQKTTKNTKN